MLSGPYTKMLMITGLQLKRSHVCLCTMKRIQLVKLTFKKWDKVHISVFCPLISFMVIFQSYRKSTAWFAVNSVFRKYLQITEYFRCAIWYIILVSHIIFIYSIMNLMSLELEDV